MGKIKITRPRVLGALFIILGLFLTYFGATGFAPAQKTTLGMGTLGTVDVGVQASLVTIGLLTVLGGVLALGERFRRVAMPILMLAAFLDILGLMIWAARGSSVDMVGMLAASLRMSTPIALGALAGILCERCAVINIGIEGMMLSAAAFGFAVNL